MFELLIINLEHSLVSEDLPTAEEETNTFGGFAASAIFLAKVLVVSMRLFLNSSKNSSFHL